MKEIKIKKDFENPLFGRREIEFEIFSEIAPTRKEAVKFLSEKFSKPEENIMLKSIKGSFGSKNFIISTNIYESEEKITNIEKNSKRRIKGGEKDGGK